MVKNNDNKLLDLLEEHQSAIQKYLTLTDARWKQLIGKLTAQLEAKHRDYYDETVWTFLLAVAYAASGEEGAAALANRLAGMPHARLPGTPIWLEALPIPPRKNEGNTNLDLACGGLGMRAGKDGGIEFDRECGDYAIFCEMKWYSDISKDVTNDPHRNQLARVIENAVTFQGNEAFPSRVFVTLVTPQVFRDRCIKSRLYRYKFEEYRGSPGSLLKEWDESYKNMPKRDQTGWYYPDEDVLKEFVKKKLRLVWVSFEELFEAAPVSDVSAEIKSFAGKSNGTGKSRAKPSE